MKKLILIMIILLPLISGCANKAIAQLNSDGTITATSAQELIKDGAILVDVRTPAEYKVDHLEDSISIPVGSITESNLEKKIKSKESQIIVYCKSGTRSKKAVSKLKALGYINVYDLGAMSNWE